MVYAILGDTIPRHDRRPYNLAMLDIDCYDSPHDTRPATKSSTDLDNPQHGPPIIARGGMQAYHESLVMRAMMQVYSDLFTMVDHMQPLPVSITITTPHKGARDVILDHRPGLDVDPSGGVRDYVHQALQSLASQFPQTRVQILSRQ